MKIKFETHGLSKKMQAYPSGYWNAHYFDAIFRPVLPSILRFNTPPDPTLAFTCDPDKINAC